MTSLPRVGTEKTEISLFTERDEKNLEQGVLAHNQQTEIAVDMRASALELQDDTDKIVISLLAMRQKRHLERYITTQEKTAEVSEKKRMFIQDLWDKLKTVDSEIEALKEKERKIEEEQKVEDERTREFVYELEWLADWEKRKRPVKKLREYYHIEYQYRYDAEAERRHPYLEELRRAAYKKWGNSIDGQKYPGWKEFLNSLKR